MTKIVLDNSDNGDILRSITWQYDGATNIVGIINDVFAKFFTNSTTKFWDEWIVKVANIDNADDFGLSIWGKLLACPRVFVDIETSDATTNILYPTEAYRALLKARFKLLGSHATGEDYDNYLKEAFRSGGDGIRCSFEDNNDMSIEFSADLPQNATYIQLAKYDLITNHPEIALIFPAGVKDNEDAESGYFGFEGKSGVQVMDFCSFDSDNEEV